MRKAFSSNGLLVDAGADLGAQNEWGMTPLLSTVVSGHPDLRQALVDMDGDANFVVPDGNPVLSHAINANRTENLQICWMQPPTYPNADGRSKKALASRLDSGDPTMRILESTGGRYWQPWCPGAASPGLVYSAISTAPVLPTAHAIAAVYKQ